MKEYFESWVNPNTNNTEQINVTEYTFEDWEQGVISGKIDIGKQLIYNDTENKYRYSIIKDKEYNKIIKSREELYWTKVDKQLQGFKNSFDSSFNNSGNKDLLLKLEIEKIEKRFNNNPLYEKIVVRGIKDYSLTNGPNCQIQIGAGDFHNIQIESLAKFLDWLRTKSSQLFIESTNKIEKTDARIWLTTIFDESIRKTIEYKGFKREIDNHGFFTINSESISTKVFTTELMCILTSKKMLVKNLETQEEFFLNGFEYMESYITGYSEGEKYFDLHYLISPNVLYGDKAETYVNDIHQNYFHIKHTGLHEGWRYVKNNFPIIITHKSIKEFGYYSGIVSKVDEMVNKYSNLFQNFDKCSKSEIEKEPIKLTVSQIALIHAYEGPQITRKNADAIAAKHGYIARTSGEGLFQDYTKYCIVANRTAKPLPFTIKKLENKIKLLESILELVTTPQAIEKAKNEINILNTFLEDELD